MKVTFVNKVVNPSLKQMFIDFFRSFGGAQQSVRPCLAAQTLIKDALQDQTDVVAS